MKLWIATYVDVNDTCDGRARVLEVCKSKEDAKAAVKADMELWAAERAGMPIVVDLYKMSAKYNWETLDDTDSCDWNIEEIEVSWLSE